MGTPWLSEAASLNFLNNSDYYTNPGFSELLNIFCISAKHCLQYLLILNKA